MAATSLPNFSCSSSTVHSFLQHPVQQAGQNRVQVEMHGGQGRGHLQEMIDIGFAGEMRLPAMYLDHDIPGLSINGQIDILQIVGGQDLEALRIDHCPMLHANSQSSRLIGRVSVGNPGDSDLSSRSGETFLRSRRSCRRRSSTMPVLVRSSCRRSPDRGYRADRHP